MNDNKIFSKSSIKKAPLLERSVTFNANQHLLTEKYNFDPAKVKLTFLKDSSPHPKPSKHIQQKPIKLIEKCVYCIENEYRKQIKEAFNKFGNRNLLSFTNKCTCSLYENAAKSAKFLNSKKINTPISHSNISMYSQENRFDYYYKNITTSLDKLPRHETKLLRTNTSESFGKNTQIEKNEDDKADFLNNILVKSSTSITTGSFSNLKTTSLVKPL